MVERRRGAHGVGVVGWLPISSRGWGQMFTWFRSVQSLIPEFESTCLHFGCNLTPSPPTRALPVYLEKTTVNALRVKGTFFPGQSLSPVSEAWSDRVFLLPLNVGCKSITMLPLPNIKFVRYPLYLTCWGRYGFNTGLNGLAYWSTPCKNIHRDSSNQWCAESVFNDDGVTTIQESNYTRPGIETVVIPS